MRILHIIGTLAPEGGGTTEAVRLLHQEVISLGHESEILCCGDPNANWVEAWNGHAHVIGEGKFGWAYHSQWLPWLYKNLERFDAVIVHGLWLYPTYAIWKALKRLTDENRIKIPSFYIFPHGMLDPWFQKAPERRLKALRNKLYWAFIERNVVNAAAGLLFTCEEEMRLARGTFLGYNPRQEYNVGYGIKEPPAHESRMDAALAEKCPSLRGRPFLLFLSRVHPKKGVDLLLQAYAEVSKAHSLPLLIIAGPGLDTPYGLEMLKLSNSLGLSQLVHFPGMLAGDAKWGAFYNCEAFILPSHQENFGIAVVEALACDKPVLITNQVNIWREIEAGHGGIVENDDQGGVNQLMNRLLDLSWKNQGTLKPKECFLRYFTIKQTAKQLVVVLEQNKN